MAGLCCGDAAGLLRVWPVGVEDVRMIVVCEREAAEAWFVGHPVGEPVDEPVGAGVIREAGGP